MLCAVSPTLNPTVKTQGIDNVLQWRTLGWRGVGEQTVWPSQSTQNALRQPCTAHLENDKKEIHMFALSTSLGSVLSNKWIQFRRNDRKTRHRSSESTPEALGVFGNVWLQNSAANSDYGRIGKESPQNKSSHSHQSHCHSTLSNPIKALGTHPIIDTAVYYSF